LTSLLRPAELFRSSLSNAIEQFNSHDLNAQNFVEDAAVGIANAGLAHIEAAELTKALSDFQEAALLCPHDSDFYVFIFSVLDALALEAEVILLAENILARVLMCEPTLPSLAAPNLLAAAHSNTGMTHADHGHIDEACAFFEAASFKHECKFSLNVLASARSAARSLGGACDRHSTSAAVAPLRALRPPLRARMRSARAAPRACDSPAYFEPG
jgi:tetratricopeptide (TPR) repeat protein